MSLSVQLRMCMCGCPYMVCPVKYPPGVYPVVNMECHVDYHVYYPVPREGRDAGGSTATPRTCAIRPILMMAGLDDAGIAGAPCTGGTHVVA